MLALEHMQSYHWLPPIRLSFSLSKLLLVSSPNLIRYPRLYRRGDAKGSMDVGGIVPRHVEVNGGIRMRELLGKSVHREDSVT